MWTTVVITVGACWTGAACCGTGGTTMTGALPEKKSSARIANSQLRPRAPRMAATVPARMPMIARLRVVTACGACISCRLPVKVMGAAFAYSRRTFQDSIASHDPLSG